MRALAWLVPAVLVAALASPAWAQYGPGYYNNPPPPPPRGFIRSGFIFGMSIGGGAISFTDCDGCDALGGLSLQAHLGGMVAPSMAVIADFAAVVHPLDDDYGGTLASGTFMVALRGWLSPQIWLEGGLGGGSMQESDDYGVYADYGTGFGALVGAGVELVQAGNFALDLQLRVSATRLEDDFGQKIGVANTSLSVGFNWY